MIALSIGATASLAGPFNSLVVFGDSLSDVGNIAQATGGLYPGSTYYSNRFSNGPVWVESLSTDLGLGAISRSKAGGNDFAYGGGQTTGTSGLLGLFIRDIDDQVGDFLGSRTVDPAALFVVYAGANDFFNGQTNVSVPVNSLMSSINRLVGAGARQFLVPNLPLLGYTPSYNTNPTSFAQFNARSEQFNASLATALDGLAAANSALTIYQLDVAAMFADAIANPAAYGLVNVTNSAAPGLEPGATGYNTSQIVPNPNEYMFWDSVHPTGTVHAALAQRAYDLLTLLPGDYNDDGVVDLADYTVWRDRVGAAAGSLPNDSDGGLIGQAQYDSWKANFGASSLTASAGSAIVPEPPTIGLLLCLVALRWRTSVNTSSRRR